MITSSDRSVLLRQLSRVTGNEDFAEDCLQTAFLRLEEYRRTVQVDNVKGFLSRIARNIAIDEVRKQRVRASTGPADEILENYRDDSPLQDEVLAGRERLSRANAILDRLPERTRTVFLKHRLGRTKYREIAQELGISVSAVEKHVARAALALATNIDDDTAFPTKPQACSAAPGSHG